MVTDAREMMKQLSRRSSSNLVASSVAGGSINMASCSKCIDFIDCEFKPRDS
jgi:hypothetical protein